MNWIPFDSEEHPPPRGTPPNPDKGVDYEDGPPILVIVKDERFPQEEWQIRVVNSSPYDGNMELWEEHDGEFWYGSKEFAFWMPIPLLGPVETEITDKE